MRVNVKAHKRCSESSSATSCSNNLAPPTPNMRVLPTSVLEAPDCKNVIQVRISGKSHEEFPKGRPGYLRKELNGVTL